MYMLVLVLFVVEIKINVINIVTTRHQNLLSQCHAIEAVVSLLLSHCFRADLIDENRGETVARACWGALANFCVDGGEITSCMCGSASLGTTPRRDCLVYMN
jgi:hypothetical protein